MNSEVGGAPVAGRTSGLAIASLVLGLLSCLCLPGPVAIVLGIIALVQMGKDPTLKGKGFAIAGIVLPVAMVPVVGILAAIAVPNFIKFNVRAKQAECRTNLRAIATAQRAREADGQPFTEDVTELGWQPDGKVRYTYVLGRDAVPGRSALFATMPEGVSESDIKDSLRRSLAGGVVIGLDPDSPSTFTAVCAGNIDSDSGLDVWSVSSIDREGPGGTISAWTPVNEWNDATDEAGTLGSSGGSKFDD